jgi:hypothetical protein
MMDDDIHEDWNDACDHCGAIEVDGLHGVRGSNALLCGDCIDDSDLVFQYRNHRLDTDRSHAVFKARRIIEDLTPLPVPEWLKELAE